MIPVIALSTSDRMSPMRRVWLVSLFLLPSLALAHEVRPGYLEITEDASGGVRILWKQPVMGELSVRIQPHLSSGWLERHPASLNHAESFLVRQWDVPAGSGALLGQSVTILGLEATFTDVLVRVSLADGTPFSRLLKPTAPSFEIRKDAAPSARAYLWLGIDHILLGVDHLLFVLGLLVIVRRRFVLMLKTISAFTVAHSLTLAASTLGIVTVPAPPLNVVVALSILFLGIEIVRQRRGETSLTIEHPWVAAFGFGLVHGFGFASGLKTLGLPQEEVLLALLLFNVGVELGQIAFVALYLAVERALRVLEVPQPRWAEAVPAYVVGSLGAYWTLAQMAAMVGSRG
jgi:hydrogenase/urease accessory protein HupE